jgi:hypothetical protein
MKLIPRHRHQRQAKAPRISINEAEIAADLHYPASRRVGAVGSVKRRRG